MERIHGTDTRIATLADRLSPSYPVRAEDAADPLPDPALLLEQERRTVLEHAQTTGLAQGLQHAEAEVQERVQAAEREVKDANAEEAIRLSEARKRLSALLNALPGAVVEAESRMEEAAIEIAYAALLQLLGETVAGGALIHQLCQRALTEYRQRPVLIRVAAEDVQWLSDLIETDGTVRVAADPRLSIGQCQLETYKGLYDTGIEIRLEALTQAFLRGLTTEAST